jgi:hypothetical protein
MRLVRNPSYKHSPELLNKFNSYKSLIFFKDHSQYTEDILTTTLEAVEKSKKMMLKSEHILWLTKQIYEKKPSIIQVEEDYIPPVRLHFQNQSLLNPISNYDNLSDLNMDIQKLDESDGDIISDKELNVFFERDGWLLSMPYTTKASIFLGKDTDWCTARVKSDNMFINYVGQAEKDILLFYIIRIKGNPHKNPNDKISVGFIDGKPNFSATRGGMTVNAKNEGVTLDAYKKILGEVVANEFMQRMINKAQEIGNKHPIKEELTLISQSAERYIKKTSEYAKENELKNFKKVLSQYDLSEEVDLLLNSVGLMSLNDFFLYINPKKNTADDETYFENEDYDDDYLDETYNRKKPIKTLKNETSRKKYKAFFFSDNGVVIKKDDDQIALCFNGILYHDGNFNPEEIPMYFYSGALYDDLEYKITYEKTKAVKYIKKTIENYRDISEENKSKYRNVIETIDTPIGKISIVCKHKIVKDKNQEIFVMEESGRIIGSISSSWRGPVILLPWMYREFDIDGYLAYFWGKINPSDKYTSMSYNDIESQTKRWSLTVKELYENGAYSRLINKGIITQGKVDEIMSRLMPQHHPLYTSKQKTKRERDVIIHADDYIFYIYDTKFFESNNESDILAYGFLRGNKRVGLFFLKIDYEEGFGEIIVLAALQFLRNEGEKLYIGQGYKDYFDEEIIDNINRDYGSPITRDGDYIFLSKDVLNLDHYKLVERNFIRKNFKEEHEKFEKITNLVEMAEAKW